MSKQHAGFRRRVQRVAALALLGCLCAAFAGAGEWPQWRGPEGSGVAPGSPPVVWSEAENVRWKVEIPGHGHASPIVWGDRIFLLSAVPPANETPATAEGENADDRPSWMRSIVPSGVVEFVVLAYERATGELAWQRTAISAEPHEGTHADATWASASPVTDGEVLIASFGSRGIFAYSVDGDLLWKRDLGDMSTRNGFGEGASPALHGDRVVVNWDHEGDSFIVVLDRRTGREIWRRMRDEPTSWSTPIVEIVGGRPQVIVSGTGAIRAYDLATGETIWQAGGMTLNVVPSPFVVDGILYAASGFRGNAVRAIRLATATGELGSSAEESAALVWGIDEDAPYVPTPVVAAGGLYMMKTNTGILTSLDAETGERRFGPVRVPGIDGVYASLVAADGRVYVVGRGGTTTVLEAGPEFSVLAENELDDRFDASPAIAGDELFLRGHRHLYCLAESEDGGSLEEAP